MRWGGFGRPFALAGLRGWAICASAWPKGRAAIAAVWPKGRAAFSRQGWRPYLRPWVTGGGGAPWPPRE